MKKLSMFQKFDFARFQEGKTFVIQSAKYNEKKGCISVDVVITVDKTDYNGDKTVSNIYQSFKVHCIKDTNEADIAKYPIGQEVKFVSIGKVSVYGDYSNMLSCEAELSVGGK